MKSILTSAHFCPNSVLCSHHAVQHSPTWTKEKRHESPKIKLQNDPQCNNKYTKIIIHNYSPVVMPKTLPPVGKSTQRDTHHNTVSEVPTNQLGDDEGSSLVGRPHN